MKRDLIFTELKRGIVTGLYAPGEKLPTELELSARYGVARGTVRESLKRLEEGGYLERVKSKGTFIRQPSHSSNEDKAISFLIPYPSYIRMCSDVTFLHFSQALYGAIRAASENGWRVETVPFSRTNNNSDIDWQALDHIREDSRLIIFNHWYYPAFETFLKRRVRVGIIRTFHHVKSPWDHCFANWIDAVVDTKKMASGAVSFLYSLGCRKILNTCWYYHDPYNEKRIGYREGIERNGLECLEFDCDIFPFDVAGSAKQIVQTIHDIWEKTHFDAFFGEDFGHYFTGRENIYHILGIPESVKVLLGKDDPAAYLRASPQISAFDIDMDRIGYTVAKRLIEPGYTPCQLVFDWIFHNRESSGGVWIPPDELRNSGEIQETCFAMV